VLLPDQLVEIPRSHPHRQWRIGSYRFNRPVFTRVKQLVAHYGRV
jgi:hypothetical protein